LDRFVLFAEPYIGKNLFFQAFLLKQIYNFGILA